MTVHMYQCFATLAGNALAPTADVRFDGDGDVLLAFVAGGSDIRIHMNRQQFDAFSEQVFALLSLPTAEQLGADIADQEMLRRLALIAGKAVGE